MTALEIAGLSVRYGGALAVDDIALSVPPGQVTALVGPNGAGKSSAVLATCGTVRSTGEVRLDGERVDGWSPGRRTRAGLALVPRAGSCSRASPCARTCSSAPTSSASRRARWRLPRSASPSWPSAGAAWPA
ncbi:ATP-binding cassette domain-containing protein, partial [Pimelobacter simplex]|uniref:ATP-binding cassette domain-containing protein n=1 Tax=Nocardioides simplex TaxID=2045 RepID=UPI001375824E